MNRDDYYDRWEQRDLEREHDLPRRKPAICPECHGWGMHWGNCPNADEPEENSDEVIQRDR